MLATDAESFGVILFIYFILRINTFIQQRLIKLIKHDTNDIYNVTKNIYISNHNLFIRILK